MLRSYLVIGLMSGTSLDGIDVALLRTDGQQFIEPVAFLTVPYTQQERSALHACLHQPCDQVRGSAVETDFTLAQAKAISALLSEQHIPATEVAYIGFHGQTISHEPALRRTCQIGNGALLAKTTGIPVVNDFRSADVRAGGQGAPLVPVYHQALAAHLEKPVVFLNIGGVANVTYVGQQHLLAFDTGPGNALVDDWVWSQTGHSFDAGGALARSGHINEPLVASLLTNPFFQQTPPKSLDRDAFASSRWAALPPADGAATLTAFTVRSIALAQQYFPETPKRWIVCGGGRHNAYLMEQLQQAVGLSIPVQPIEALGLNGDATEAEAFGYLAVRSVQDLPLSYPDTTGVPKPMRGGVLHATARAAPALTHNLVSNARTIESDGQH